MQKLLRCIVFVLVASLAAFHPLEAKQKHSRHANHTAPPTEVQPSSAKAAIEQPRDPAEAALDKRIKSICRGC